MIRLKESEPWTIPPWTLLDAVKDKRILITGAGGSIGSELSRQVAKGKPEHLALLSHSEYPIYRTHSEIKDISCQTVLADIRSETRMRQVMREVRPDIVFHCAAIKHLPMAEDAPCEAALTNVIGTLNVLESLPDEAVMVLVSTDKAVNPSSVMGETKRVAELLCASSDKDVKIVRLGNVVGSSGSVVPLFKKQIDEGIKVCVTHRDVSRYFMEVSEAVSLIIQTLIIDEGSNLFILDMGDPVKIYDLAVKMIRESGKQIPIQFIGLRQGEKITEELFYPDESPVRSRCDGIFQGMPRVEDYKRLADRARRLEVLSLAGDETGARYQLNKLISVEDVAA